MKNQIPLLPNHLGNRDNSAWQNAESSEVDVLNEFAVNKVRPVMTA